MKMMSEEQVLDVGFRKQVIDEIEGNENRLRKEEMLKRYKVFKDETKEYVIAAMEQESEDKEVVQEIINRSANISFCRKVIDKKSMVYKDGVQRIAEQGQELLDFIIDFVNLNSHMKKVNKYAELFKNAVIGVLPYKDPVSELYSYMIRVLQPYLYDVIEDEINPEIARAYITSYFTPEGGSNYVQPNRAGYRDNKVMNLRKSDGIDQTIADNPQDFGANNKEYVWWTNKYHFTTDRKGQIIPGKQEPSLENPIGILPYYNFSQDQDGQFWAKGGDDIVDGAILLNTLLTDLFYIAKYQGMGIGYLFGKGVPKKMKVGASAFVSLNVEDGDPTPQMGFASSNPPITAHLEMIEKYVAFLLSTNNLEPGTVQGELSAAGAASGIQEMVRKSEMIDDLVNQREIYRDGEPRVFAILAKWHNLYWGRKLLVEKLQQLGKIDEEMAIKIRFPDPQPFMTETQKLEVIEKRKQLGLDSMVDAILRDNPDLSRKEAEEKARMNMKEKLKESSARIKAFQSNTGDAEEDVEDDEEKDVEENEDDKE